MPAIGLLLTNWKLIVIGLLVAALGVQTLRLAWAQNELVEDRLAQAKAVQEAKDKAKELSDELIIAQAAAMAVTEKKVTEYVDRIRTVTVPDTACAADPRMRIGNHGVRDIVGGGGSPTIGGATAPVSRPGPGPRP